MLNFKFLKISALTEILSFGSASLLKSLSSLITNQGTIFAVGVILSVMFVPVLSIPLLLMVTIGGFVGKVGTSFMPIASALHSRKETEKIIKLSTYGFKYTFFIGAFISLLIFVYGEKLLVLWLPADKISGEEIKTMATILMTLVIPFMLARSNQGNRVILINTDNHWLVSKLLVLNSIMGILLSIYLMENTDLGVYGALIGILFKLIIGDYLLILYCMLRKFSIGFYSYFKLAYLKVLVITSILFPLVFFLKLNMTGHLINDLTVFLLISILFSVLGFFFVFERSHLAMFIPNTFDFIKIRR